MPKNMTIRELELLLNGESSITRARKKIAREIAKQGSWNSELELRRQERRRHYSGYHEPVENRIIESLPYSQPKHRKVTPIKSNARSLATVSVSYNLRDKSLYWYGHSIAAMANYYKRGAITKGEWREFVNAVKLMGGGE